MADDYLNIGGNKLKLVDLGDGSYGFAADCPDLETLIGALNAAAVTDPAASASAIALLKGVIKQLQGNGSGSMLMEITDSVPLEIEAIKGTATDGSETMVIDSTKDFEADVLIGKVVKITIDGVDYFRKIIGSVADSFLFPAILAPVAAFAVVGSGEGAEGQVIIRCQGTIDGAAGNAYSVEIVQGIETTGDNVATLEGTVLTITVNLDGLGDPRNIGAGDLQALIAGTVGVADKFIVDDVFVAGNLPIGDPATPFAGGVDGISVTAGTEYVVEVGEPSVEVNNLPATQNVALTGSIPAGANEIGKMQITGSILDELAEAIRIKLVASDVILPTDKQAIYRPQAVLETTNLAGGAAYTSPSYDGSQYRRITGKVFSDQSGALNLQHSDDGTTWDTLTTVAATGGTAAKFDEPLYAKYVRLNYVNGATLQTAFRLSAYLSVE